jgi:MFS family permease
MIEWYDFYIYATAAALVFGQLYFPSHDPFVSTMASFATFAVGFFARPLGGIVFGHLGDRIGRKKALMTTLMMMGVATVCVGLLPDYSKVGVLAPVLLVALRVVQGIAVGGEWGGAVLMAGEHAPQGRRTFFASFAQLGSPAGLILSLVAFRAVTSMDKADFLAWGWRVPFLASAVLLVVGILIRLGVNESPEFARVKEANRTVKLPVAEVFRSASGLVLLCIGANTIGIAGVYFTNTFMIAYTTQYVGVSRSLILDSLFAVAIIQFVAQPARRVARRAHRQRAVPEDRRAARDAVAVPDVHAGAGRHVRVADRRHRARGRLHGRLLFGDRRLRERRVSGPRALFGDLARVPGVRRARRRPDAARRHLARASLHRPVVAARGVLHGLAGISLLCIVALDARRVPPAAAEALGSH